MQESAIINNNFFRGNVMLDSNNETAWFLVPGPIEVLYGCIYYGVVEYLSHEARTRIIQNSCGEDFDILPKDFDGPLSKEVRTTLLKSQSDMGLTLIREWDGTVDVVKVVDNTLIYSDGVRYEVSPEYLRALKRDVFSKMPVEDEDHYW
jgi:hypothetical protein